MTREFLINRAVSAERHPSKPDFNRTIHRPSSVSRRDVIFLGAGLAALTAVGGCSRPAAAPDDRTTLRVLRPDDLLSLDFELRNLRIESDGFGTARLVRVEAGEDAFLLVRFPGQHIAEQAINAAQDGDEPVKPPLRALIAPPSRLVFRIPPGIDSLALSLDSLLAWERFEYWTPDAGAEDLRSQIELPTGLALASNGPVRWDHAVRPVVSGGRTELWHTRLVSAAGTEGAPVRILEPGYFADIGFDTPLTESNRRTLIGKTARARTLVLSSMGGWLDVRGRWEAETGADLARWEQMATAGQDQRVVVEQREGFLYPFGHRATVLSVTERTIEDVASVGAVALLRKRNFVVVKEPEVSYRPGEMPLQTLTVRSEVTSALRIPDADAPAFWIETSPGAPYPFRLTGRDWADDEVVLEAPAVFVQSDTTQADADAVYGDEAYRAFREASLRGQSVAVARFEPAVAGDDADDGDDPAQRTRSAGDTTLQLLTLAFIGVAGSADDDSRLFRCATERMLVRIPSLEPFLDETRNRGWFNLIDPDAAGNRGEVFARARARADDVERIPMYFDQQADRSGGLAAPSFDVDGMSRLHGPVGNAELVMSGDVASGAGLLNAERATLLNGFPLATLLASGGDNPSPAIPRIDFILGRMQPKQKDEPDKDPQAGDQPAPQPDPPKPEESAYWEVGLGLTWSVPLGSLATPLVSFEPVRDDKENSLSKLEIEVKATRRLGGSGEPAAPAEGEAAPEESPGETGTTPAKAPPPAVNLTASGKITNFAFVVNLSRSDSFSIVFDHITVKLGPPKPKKDEAKKETPDEPGGDTADTEGEDKKKEPSVSVELEFELAKFDATGGLNFVKRVIEAVAKLPPLPDLPGGEAPTAYPAKLPGAGGADLNVTLGPFAAPKFMLMQFEASNISASFGIGLNFLPRATHPDLPATVPDHMFAIRVASPDKPITLLSGPWGGIAHLGLNFTMKRVTGFQFSLGAIYKTEFKLGVGKAKCEGSLAGAYTYWVKDDDDHYQLDLILKLHGQAAVLFMDIHLTLIAIGSRSDSIWSFSAELVVRVEIAFFAVQARFAFYHEIADDSGEDKQIASAGDGDADLGEAEWRAYRAAFAQAA